MKRTEAWVLAVALAGGVGGVAQARGDADPVVVTYAQDIKPLLDGHCVECHHHGGHDPDLSGFPFRSKTNAEQDAIVGKMLGLVQGTPTRMPPGNRTKLTAGQAATIQAWRDQGLPETN